MNMPILQQINNRDNTASMNAVVSEAESFWGKDGFTFGDVVDMFNPLQHLPFVSKYYREHADDDACEGSKLIGGALFGGLFGGAAGVLSSIANSAVRHETHQDVSEHLLEIVDDSFEHSAKAPLYTTAEGSLHTAAEGSLQKAAEGSLNRSINTMSYTVAEAFLHNEDDEALYMTAESSLHMPAEGSSNTITTQKNIQQIKSQPELTNNERINPFFAQVLDEYSDFSSRGNTSNQRSREWGKV
jgi:hypothetical protein